MAEPTSILSNKTLEPVENKKNTYKAVDRHGNKITLTVKAIPAMTVQQVAASIEQPDRPKYKVTMFGGKTAEHPLDEQAALDFLKEDTEEGRRYWDAWQTYKQEKELADARYTERVMKVLFLYGVDCDLPKDQSFFEDDAFLGLDIPTNPRHLKVHYLMNHLTDGDTVTLMTHIMAATGVDEKVVREAEKSFRDSVREGEE